jgi:hypothetical protein
MIMHDHQQSTRDAPTPAQKPMQDKADKAVETLEKDKGDHQEDLLDEGIEESFPASDPVSVKRIT